MYQDIRVRIAPSPTGLFHIGTARSALFNWLFAKKHGGKFILRVEDTDKERSKKEFEKSIVDGLKLLGLSWDEFYRQSERTVIYKKYLQKLLEEKKAYWKENAIWFVIDQNRSSVAFKDIVREHVEFPIKEFDDFVIAKDLETPLYHFVVVVDDHEMGVSHVIRGEEHLTNTPKHILLQEALGFPQPIYAHLPLILAPDRTKLSKRHGATSLSDYIDQGFLPQAVLNYLFPLGGTPTEGREVFSLDEMISAFDLVKVHKAGAVFDIKKLEWINGEYIKKMSDDELLMTIGQKYEKILPLVRERMKKKSDLEEFDFFFTKPKVDPEMLKWKKATLEDSKSVLARVAEILKNVEWNKEAISYKLEAISSETGDRGLVYWPFRVALSGRLTSPDPVDIAVIIGVEETLIRIKNALSE